MAGLRKILLVEDDLMIQELYSSVLLKAGYTVQIVSTAPELYEKLKHFQPDCILLDIMLPETTGLTILGELRSNPQHGCQYAKIIIMTNLTDESIKAKIIESGADGYVIKSEILPKDLLKIIPSLED